MKTIKNTIRKPAILIASLLTTGLLAITGLSLLHAAGSASFSLSPSSGSYNINTNFSAAIYENSGAESVNAVDVELSYDQSKLQFVSVTNNGSPFAVCTKSSGGGGSVSLVCADLNGSVTGGQLVGSVTFKTLAGSGTTSVSFATSSHIVRSSDQADVWNGNTNGGSYSLTTPAAPTPTSGSTSTTTSPPTSASSSSTPNTSTNTKPKTATPSGGNSTQPASPSTSTSTSTNPALAPGPLAASSGTLIAVKVTDSQGKPVKDADVVLNAQTAKTDATGVASFYNVTPGDYAVKIHSVLGDSTKNITVTPNQAPGKVQQFDVKLAAKKSLMPFILILPGIMLAVAILFRKMKGRQIWDRKHNQLGYSQPAAMSQDPVSLGAGEGSGNQSIDERLQHIQAEIPSPSEVIHPEEETV